jgi:hypothetical protein
LGEREGKENTIGGGTADEDEAVVGGKGEAPRRVTVRLTQLASDRWTPEPV